MVQQRRRKPEFVDPSLILRVQMTGALLEADWEHLGLTVLSSDADRTLVLFASNDEMQEFRARLDAYHAGAPPGQKNAPYNTFIGSIDRIGSVEPRDRIGLRFREEGFVEVDDFGAATQNLVDLELWTLESAGFANTRSRISSDISRHAARECLINMSAHRSP